MNAGISGPTSTLGWSSPTMPGNGQRHTPVQPYRAYASAPSPVPRPAELAGNDKKCPAPSSSHAAGGGRRELRRVLRDCRPGRAAQAAAVSSGCRVCQLCRSTRPKSPVMVLRLLPSARLPPRGWWLGAGRRCSRPAGRRGRCRLGAPSRRRRSGPAGSAGTRLLPGGWSAQEQGASGVSGDERDADCTCGSTVKLSRPAQRRGWSSRSGHTRVRQAASEAHRGLQGSTRASSPAADVTLLLHSVLRPSNSADGVVIVGLDISGPGGH